MTLQSTIHTDYETLSQQFPFPIKAPDPQEPVTPSLFLRLVFGALPYPAACWVTAFTGDPANATPKDWKGWSYRPLDPDSSEVGAGQALDAIAKAGANTFFTVSSFNGLIDPQGHTTWPGRRESLHHSTPVIVFDDIGPDDGLGAKVDPGLWPIGLSPSYCLETSPRNHQIGLILDPAANDPRLVAGLLTTLVHKGLRLKDDPGMKGVTRYVRLPQGGNWKAKYKAATGGADFFPHHLWHWDLSQRYTVRQIQDAFGITDAELEEAMTGLSATGSDIELDDDPWWALLREVLPVRGHPNRKGSAGTWVDVECPWIDEHTDRDPSGTAYGSGGAFQCHHGHCHERTFIDVKKWLCGSEPSGNHRLPPSLVPVPDPIRKRAIELAREQRFDWTDGGNAPGPREAFANVPVEATAPPVTGQQSSAQERLDVAMAEYQQALEAIPEWHRPGILQAIAKDEWNPAAKDRELEQALLAGVDVKKGQLDAWHKKLKAATKAHQKAELAVSNAAKAARASDMRNAEAIQKGTTSRYAFAQGMIEHELQVKIEKDDVKVVLNLVSNLRKIIEFGCNHVYPGLQFNQMTDTYEIHSPKKLSTAHALHDADIDALQADLAEDFYIQFPRELVARQMERYARSRPYHPVMQYLRSLRWDGQPRLEGWIARALGCPDDPYHRAVGRLLVVGAVSRAMRPGCKFDHVVILKGPEAAGKSTFCECLAVDPKWFADIPINPKNLERSAEAMHGCWIVEIGELKGISKVEDEEIKQYITCKEDRFRRPFARFPATEPRGFIMIGTTNQEAFLRSVTGNRRFLPVSCGTLDLDWFSLERDQIMAEAVCAVDQGAIPALDPSMWATAKEVQEEHRDRDEWELEIIEYLTSFEGGVIAEVPASKLWDHLGVTKDRRSANGQRFRRVMTGLGYVRGKGMRRFETGQNPQYYWVLNVKNPSWAEKK